MTATDNAPGKPMAADKKASGPGSSTHGVHRELSNEERANARRLSAQRRTVLGSAPRSKV